MSKSLVVKIMIVSILLVVIGIGSMYFFQPKKTVSQEPLENKIVAVEKKPSETLKIYSDSAGFGFRYPQDVEVNKKDTSDPNAYASLEITSSQTKGNISINVLDTKLKTIDDWFLEKKITTLKEIKIGEISGKEGNMGSNIVAAALDSGILFAVEVDSQNQKYWVDVYNSILSSFNFVLQQTSDQPSDDSSSDVVLDEETVE